ncbi:hypothetical protein ALC60_13231 [Trachymyrmex zeteki]|uniref:ISXO2-like transposase domain-containing protein n=1 Tax=Mycetomoellerius zeteki TaxID=64791 RepID=A0A151WIP7_9HYME|nr:hypothetical protein ALC60_13231 [Trachymyrmex zeteki]
MLSDFINLTYNRDKLIEFLIQHGVLPVVINCNQCESILNLNTKTLMFICRKRHFVKNTNKKRISQQCKFERSAKVGTWFDNTNLDVSLICRLTVYFIMFPPPRVQFLTLDTGLTKVTVIDWLNFCREICVYWAKKHCEKIGGPGHIVEVDEAKFGHRKYNRGRVVDGRWVFGGIDRESKKIFLLAVQDRTHETLLKCIKEWILPGSTIISDCWKSYKYLENEGFQHLTVNHSYNFVDPDTSKVYFVNTDLINITFANILIFFKFIDAHTQNIERVWREVRANIPKYGILPDHFEGYLSEYLFKRNHDLEKRIDSFFDIISQVYPPKLNVQCQQASSSNVH